MGILRSKTAKITILVWTVLSVVCYWSMTSVNMPGYLTFNLQRKLHDTRELRQIGIYPDRVLKCRPYTLYKGDYLGIETIQGERYYHYIIPNIYSQEKSFFDLKIPVDYSKAASEIKMREILSAYTSAHSVYVAFTDSFHPAMNPRYVNSDIDVILDSRYPCLMLFGINGRGQKATLRIGRKAYYNDLNNRGGSEVGNNYYKACRETPKDSWSIHDTVEIKPGSTFDETSCDLWSWSDTLKSEQEYRRFTGAVLSFMQNFGSVVTVPLDIISSPVQITIINIHYR